MANLRVIYDNAIDRATTLTASTTSGTLAAANMQTDYKGTVHRSTGTSVTYTATWTNGESLGGVSLPCFNGDANTTIRVRRYSDTAGVTLIDDSGTVAACTGVVHDLAFFTAINANSFAYGGLAKSSVWFSANVLTKRLVIDIVDTGNAAGFIDCARIVAGAYWEPLKNADYGVKAGLEDTTKSTRNDAGDSLADLGTKHDVLSFDLRLMNETDRATLRKIVKGPGAARNILISVYPGNSNNVLEQDHTVFGKRANSDASADYFGVFGSSVSLDGW